MRLSTFYPILGFLMVVMQKPTMALELHCPATIVVSQTVIEAPSTWVADNSQRIHKLSGAGFTYGPPREMGFLKPIETKNKGKLRIVIHEFEGVLPERDWLNCRYEGTATTVGQPIPTGIRQCDIIYEVGRRDEWKFQSIQCK